MKSTERLIAHIDMDAFFVSVEEALDPALKGKPVIVGGNPDGRGVVSAASYTARRYGVKSAMPIAQAKKLCPKAIFLRGSMAKYSDFSRRIFKILDQYSPLVEPVSVDEAYIDLTGCDRLHGPILKTVESIRKNIWENVGVPASAGIASNKLLAKIASGFCKPSGMLWIFPGKEQRFLQPLPHRRIPGVGAKAELELLQRGIRKIGDLAAMPEEKLINKFGKFGASLARKSRGICDRPVETSTTCNRSISRETTLKKDTNDKTFLRSLLSLSLEKATAQLRRDKLYAKCISIKIRYSDFKTATHSKTLDSPTAEDLVFLPAAIDLFQAMLKGNCKKIRLLGVCLTSITNCRNQQIPLFHSDRPEQMERLYRSMDNIRNKYGFNTIKKAGSYLD